MEKAKRWVTEIQHSMVVLRPISFPEEIEIRNVRFDPWTGQATGECTIEEKHRSWDWIRRTVPLSRPAYFDECEGYLKEGLLTNLVSRERSVLVEEVSAS